MKYQNNSLKRFHTFKINAYAKKIIIIKSINDLIKARKKYKKIPILFLGEGSNTLFSKYYNGIVAINKIKSITITETESNWLIYVKGGVKWHDLVIYTIKMGIYGLENLAFIPGTVGAAPIQNIGAYGIEFKNVCNYVEIFSLIHNNIIKIKNKNCMFKYRSSIFKNANYYNYIVLGVEIKLSKKWIPNISHPQLKNLELKNLTAHKILNHIQIIRKNKIPNLKSVGHSGSFFKNPIVNTKTAMKLLSKYKNLPCYPEDNEHVKISAGWLIEECQLKGYKIGGAQIYKKQALILINKNNATIKDVLKLTQIVQDRVKKKFNIFLELEVTII
ncbi:UDP-N-acetylenolpyruvoylglucosamine reductase [Buchnera aphidicola (Schlechtendalia chinensis)]|uniref:UDP-N-acetylenolpyruvoylglucosamine reductase n=1 Tax=Buchnera aphidicola subsp. Schlechtendalia chinensis TaxID=118110 RepID=A0A172WD28_BUCSC|nr:UDP-N-acetylmuramate dehydrogenase [Buchnera aphidicola]ANF16865.1 UDP-N-acetylenolpyruvoylglucosamine reductase [Buchnera aphidicola (Schlechtendalia chinensis)]